VPGTSSRCSIERLDNGLVFLCEAMPQVRSAAVTILVPSGVVAEPSAESGTAAAVAEWLTRGAGDLDGEALISAIDSLGTSHSEAAGVAHTSIAATTLGKNFARSLELLADLVRRPRLDPEQLDPIRDLCLQGLRSIEDDPAAKVLVELRKYHYGEPWGRPTQGTFTGLEQLTARCAARFHAERYQPTGAIIAVAGAIDADAIRQTIKQRFGEWPAGVPQASEAIEVRPTRHHIEKESQQIQIAMAYPASRLQDPDYYATRAAANILGGYASSRLFVEVREKRGLCYSVYASYEPLKPAASIVCHAGSASDRAQETLDVMTAEVQRLAREGVSSEELDMMRAGLKSSLIMQQESTLSRSGALAADWYHLGRVRTIEEIAAALDQLSTSQVSAAAAKLAQVAPSIITLGPKALELPV
jgi:predicted Zn-dependent peptidase